MCRPPTSFDCEAAAPDAVRLPASERQCRTGRATPSVLRNQRWQWVVQSRSGYKALVAGGSDTPCDRSSLSAGCSGLLRQSDLLAGVGDGIAGLHSGTCRDLLLEDGSSEGRSKPFTGFL